MEDGHRKFVGGHWGEAGRRQLDFLISEGLKPWHNFLDIGCGCARAGIYLVDYLDKNRYYGLDHHDWLIDAGNKELGGLIQDKSPMFIINDTFDFSGIKCKINVAIAKSVFTHLTLERIKQCLSNLKCVLDSSGVFYASVFIGDSKDNLTKDDDTRKFSYSLEEIKSVAKGWNVESMGKKGTFYQTMLKFTKKVCPCQS